MYYCIVQFNNNTRRVYKTTKGNPEGLLCGQLPHCLLLKYQNLEPAKQLLNNEAYYCSGLRYRSMARMFGAKVVAYEKADGRTSEIRTLPWFSAEEFLRNY